MLPNLIVIGAGKSGTTSFHYYLDQHPEIYMSKPKEPHLFQRPQWRERLDWYESLFPVAAPIRGESSPGYSTYPVHQHVPERIQELIPDAKLIYLVRDPIERVTAHHAQHLINGKEKRPLDQALSQSLSDGDQRLNPYLATSSYATQIEQFLDHFPQEQLHVIDQAELRSDRLATLQSAFSFLGVDQTFESPSFNQVLLTKDDQFKFGPMWGRVRNSPLNQVIRHRVPLAVRRPVTVPLRRLVGTRVERLTLSEPLRAALADFFEADVRRLREMTGKSFETWSV